MSVIGRSALIVFILASAIAGVQGQAGTAVAVAAVNQPNVVFIMLDDVPRGMWDAMPTVRREILQQGVRFANGMVPTSLCCPSRSSLLTGNYAHTTGVYDNNSTGHGGWLALQPNEGSTLATHLDDAGYRTSLVGKYVNGYYLAPPTRGLSGYVPPGWDDFVAFQQPKYYNYHLVGTVDESYGSAPADYSTDVLTQHAVDIVTSTPASTPLFLYYAPFAAHAPFAPAPRDVGTWHLEPLPGGFNEKDMSDKPAFMNLFEMKNPSTTQHMQQRQHEVLMSADDGVANIIDALGSRADNTLFVLMSDNGFQTGVHRLYGKNWAFRRSTEVPMAARWDGQITPWSVSQRITLNIDLTATIAEATGTSWRMEGTSALSTERTGTVLEQIEMNLPTQATNYHPAYCGYRTVNWLFVEWSADQGRELYDYRNDPYELHNLADDPAYHARMSAMRDLAMAACSPVPPDFTW